MRLKRRLGLRLGLMLRLGLRRRLGEWGLKQWRKGLGRGTGEGDGLRGNVGRKIADGQSGESADGLESLHHV